MNNNIWDYFDRKVCLTLDDKRPSGKPSRWPDLINECKRVGLSDVQKFQALKAIGPHQSFTLSQKKILQEFIESDNKYLLTLEDDVKFLDISPLRDAIYDIKVNGIKWHVLYLGGNIKDKCIKYRRNLSRVSNVWTTHAVAYSRFAAQTLLLNFPNENELMYDNHLGNMLKFFNSFMINPMVAIQRPDYSDIWQSNVDYTEIFNNSQKQMR
jgi:hypothetical protein